MGTTLVSQIDIDASPVQVWRALTDLSGYSEWNPFIVRAEGRVEVGSRLALRMQPVGGAQRPLGPPLSKRMRAPACAGEAVWVSGGSWTPSTCSGSLHGTAAGRACTRTSTSLAYWCRCWPSRCIARLVRRSMP